MKFVNLKEQYIYDGELPYIHWYPGQISTGLFQYLQLAWIKDTNAPSKISTPDSYEDETSVFGILDTSQLMKLVDNDLQDKVVDSLTIEPAKIDDKNYICVAYLICKSDIENEFIWDIDIDGTPYKVGAEFYSENEALKINLVNKGVEIPDIINKALYQSDLYERDPDHVVLNRKWRELLIQFMETLGTKGSYSSLINSLKWFEYGDLVELREIWKAETPDGTKYYDMPIQKMLTNEYNLMITNSAKTTSFYLRNLINDTWYAHDSRVDKMARPMNCKWCLDEMKLKMILLGNFFEKYFMPIHTELIRSVCEEIDRETEIRMDFANSSTKLWVDTHTTQYNLEITAPSSASLTNVVCYSGLKSEDSDPYDHIFEAEWKGKDDDFMLAVHPYEKHQRVSGRYQGSIYRECKMFGGIGVLVPFVISLPNRIAIKEIEMSTSMFGEYKTFTEKLDGNKDAVSFTLLIKNPGNLNFVFTVTGVDENVYIGNHVVKVEDNLVISLDFKKIIWKGMDINPFIVQEEEGWEKYMFTRTKFNQDLSKPISQAYIPAMNADATGDTPRTTRVRTLLYHADTIDDIVKMAQDLNRCYNERFDSSIYNFDDCEDNIVQLIKKIGDEPVQLNHFKEEDVVMVDPRFLAGHWDKYGMNFYYRIGSSIVGDTTFYDYIFEDNDIKDGHWLWIQFITLDGHLSQVLENGITEEIPGEELFKNAPGGEVFDNEVFIPEFHEPVITGGSVEQKYPIIITPVINEGETITPVMYSNETELPSWEILPWTLQSVDGGFDQENIFSPFLASQFYTNVPCGMYDIIFRYNWSGRDKEIKTTAPFRIIPNKK